MTKVPVSMTLFEYRGKRYPRHSGGDDYVRLQTDGPPSHEIFPDAIEFNDDPSDPWVKLPRSAISGRYAQEVTATWHGVPVTIDERVRHGLSRGMVTIRYEGVEPATARAAGLTGNQNDGWSALVSPDEVERVHVETTRLPPVRE
ncbi:hypothetical protein [Microbacterium sp. IEGM 1404]|uniref:hypothetical protein n=1 Tax=Microbacterium sp. IEGM 1404 TaxID=3047084 RepID=UPI0024B6D169|nr:hypothetical protein [Microbacterium sp. IEGM 1404]